MLERQQSISLAAQIERDQRIARLTDELALLEQAEAKAVEATRRAGPELREHANDRRPSVVKQNDVESVDMQTRLKDIQVKLDELLLSRDQQIGQYEKKLQTCAPSSRQMSPSDYDSRTRKRVWPRSNRGRYIARPGCYRFLE